LLIAHDLLTHPSEDSVHREPGLPTLPVERFRKRCHSKASPEGPTRGKRKNAFPRSVLLCDGVELARAGVSPSSPEKSNKDIK
jgi:hypothetical protein